MMGRVLRYGGYGYLEIERIAQDRVKWAPLTFTVQTNP